MPDASIKQVADYFKTGDPTRDTLSQFSAEWKQLSDEDKDQIRAGIGNETYNY